MVRDSDIIEPNRLTKEHPASSLRPRSFGDFIGQDQIKANLGVFIEAALRRDEALDHILLSGPPGLGKTTLAHIIAQTLGANIRTTAGPVIARAGDLAALLTHMESGDVLFIDEIHRLSPAIEEILYPAMEDQVLDVMIGEGPAARSVRIDLPPFTLIGATTRSGLLTTPLRDRFGIPLRLDFYQPQELAKIIMLAAKRMALNVSGDGAWEIASRARGTPRIAIRLLRRTRDFAETGNTVLDRACVERALSRLDVDAKGLDTLDRRYLQVLAQTHGGGPVGVDTLAATLSETRDAIEDVLEPYLMQQGFVSRTPRGRVATQQTYSHLGLAVPPGVSSSLFAEEETPAQGSASS